MDDFERSGVEASQTSPSQTAACSGSEPPKNGDPWLSWSFDLRHPPRDFMKARLNRQEEWLRVDPSKVTLIQNCLRRAPVLEGLVDTPAQACLSDTLLPDTKDWVPWMDKHIKGTDSQLQESHEDSDLQWLDVRTQWSLADTCQPRGKIIRQCPPAGPECPEGRPFKKSCWIPGAKCSTNVLWWKQTWHVVGAGSNNEFTQVMKESSVVCVQRGQRMSQ